MTTPYEVLSVFGFVFGLLALCYPVICGGKTLKDILGELCYRMKWANFRGSFLCKEIMIEMMSAKNDLVTCDNTKQRIKEICLSLNFALTDEQHLECLLQAIRCLETVEVGDMGRIFSLNMVAQCASCLLLPSSPPTFRLWNMVFFIMECRYPSYKLSKVIGWKIIGAMCDRIVSVSKRDDKTRFMVMQELERNINEQNDDKNILQIKYQLWDIIRSAFDTICIDGQVKNIYNKDYPSIAFNDDIIEKLGNFVNSVKMETILDIKKARE